MTITITPFKIDRTIPRSLLIGGEASEEQATIVYWGIYLNDQIISFTSSKELAEKTKEWMENWLRGQRFGQRSGGIGNHRS